MPAPNLTAAGLTIQTLDEALAQIASDVRGALGQQMKADSPLSVIGIIDAIVARYSAAVQAAIQGVYLAHTVGGASGTDLDRLFELAGLYRKAATHSRVTLHMANASAGVVTIPATALATISNTTYQFVMGALFTVAASGTADISVLAVGTGPTPVTAGQTWAWVSAFSGSTSITITNPADGVTGTHVETDGEFKLRFVQSLALPGSGTLAAIRAAVLAILAVQEVAAFENDGQTPGITSPVTIPAIPAHSFTVAVKGTQTEQSVGDAIFARKPAGIGTFGDTDVTVTDDQGYTRTIYYQTAAALPIYVTVHVYGPTGLTGYQDAIRAAILAYVNGAAATPTVAEIPALTIAQAALFNRIYAVISNVCDSSGLDATNIVLTFGTTASPVGTSNITPLWYQYCTLADGNLITAVN